MQDGNAVQEVAQLAIDANASRIPEPFDKRVVALPDDYSIHDLEKYAPGRTRFRGTLSTDSIDAFVSHVARRHGPVGDIQLAPIPVFVQAASAQAIFNLGTAADPGHADDVARLTVPHTAAYAAMLAADGKQRTQRDMIDWLEDWAPVLRPVAIDGETITVGSMTLAAAIAAIRTVTVKAVSETTNDVGEMRATRTAMDDIEARSRTTLPSGFQFVGPPMLGLPPITVLFRLSILTGGREPVFVLRLVGREAMTERVTQDFAAVLQERLGEHATITAGSFTA